MPSGAQNSIKIMLVDKHALVRTGLRMLIESQPGMSVVGEAGNSADALVVAASERPDIILLEPNGKEPIPDCVARLTAAANRARVILVTDECDPDAHQQAIQSGVIGIVLKEQPADVLIKAIAKVHAGEAWIDRSLMADMLTKLARGWVEGEANPEAEKIAALSDKEREVITLIGQGLKNKEIAKRLSLSEVTVRHRLTSIFSKLSISDRLELILYAFQHDLVRLPR